MSDTERLIQLVQTRRSLLKLQKQLVAREELAILAGEPGLLYRIAIMQGAVFLKLLRGDSPLAEIQLAKQFIERNE